MEKHTLSSFDDELVRLQSLMLTMASLCRQNLKAASVGLLQRDRAACSEVIADEAEINNLEKLIDHNGIEIITRFQPVASDLRNVISNMKLAQNLERVGDQSVSIARRARRLLDEAEFPEVHQLEPLFAQAERALRDAILAYNESNTTLANEVIAADKQLDTDHKELIRHFTSLLHGRQDPHEVIAFVDLLFVTRAIERIGDHAKNIAEEAIFVAEAVDVRHTRGDKQH